MLTLFLLATMTFAQVPQTDCTTAEADAYFADLLCAKKGDQNSCRESVVRKAGDLKTYGTLMGLGGGWLGFFADDLVNARLPSKTLNVSSAKSTEGLGPTEKVPTKYRILGAGLGASVGMGLAWLVTERGSTKAFAETCAKYFSWSPSEREQATDLIATQGLLDTVSGDAKKCEQLVLVPEYFEKAVNANKGKVPPAACKVIRSWLGRRAALYEALKNSKISGDCAKASLNKDGEAFAEIEKASSDKYLLKMKKDGVEITIPYQNVGGLKLDLERSSCTKSGRPDIACQSQIRGHFPEGGNLDQVRKMLSHHEKLPLLEKNFCERGKKSPHYFLMCDLSKNSQFIYELMALQSHRCSSVPAARQGREALPEASKDPGQR